MWLSEKMRQKAGTSPGAELGVATLGDDDIAVLTRGEIRDLTVYGPAGYAWRPKAGAGTLVIKTDGGHVALGQPADTALAPGEVRIHSDGGAEIRLKPDSLTLAYGGSSIHLGPGGLTLSGGGSSINLGLTGVSLSGPDVTANGKAVATKE
ncbi:hypothetical protein LJC32_04960 [Oscillospiraceae bacterium OttesenSCG-928-F05]|nr:hypothetical protein [Oscillospiraceae bacterium OttesenSCG-928-F05]